MNPEFKLNPYFYEDAHVMLGIYQNRGTIEDFINNEGILDLPNVQKILEQQGFKRVTPWDTQNTFIFFQDFPLKQNNLYTFIFPKVYYNLALMETFFTKRELYYNQGNPSDEMIEHVYKMWIHTLTYFRASDFKQVICPDYRTGVMDAVIYEALYFENLMNYYSKSEVIKKCYEMKSRNAENLKAIGEAYRAKLVAELN